MNQKTVRMALPSSSTAILLRTIIMLLALSAECRAAGLQQKIASLLAHKDYAGVQFGMCITDARGKTLFAFHDTASLIPASNQKLVTGACGLLRFGPGHRFATSFYRRGRLEHGELQGDLVVRGTGAVELTARYTENFDKKKEILSAQLDNLAQRIRGAGISRIGGNILVDGSAWSDLVLNAQYPSAGSVTFNENTVEIQVAGAKIRTIPENVLHFKLVPQNSGPRQEKALANGVPTDRILINTACDSTDYWRIDTISAEEYYRQNIASALSHRGIAVAGTAGAAGSSEELLFTLEGIPVSEYVYRMFTDSDNLRAELLFLNLGYVARGKANYENASAACADLLRKHKILPEQGSLADGSGLSRDNRISAKALARLLRFMSGDKNREAFRSSLAIAGLTGTLKNKFSAQELTGKVQAKSGTLDDVLSLSGFAETERGEAVFSFIANQVEDKKKIWHLYEKILLCLVTTGRP